MSLVVTKSWRGKSGNAQSSSECHCFTGRVARHPEITSFRNPLFRPGRFTVEINLRNQHTDKASGNVCANNAGTSRAANPERKRKRERTNATTWSIFPAQRINAINLIESSGETFSQRFCFFVFISNLFFSPMPLSPLLFWYLVDKVTLLPVGCFAADVCSKEEHVCAEKKNSPLVARRDSILSRVKVTRAIVWKCLEQNFEICSTCPLYWTWIEVPFCRLLVLDNYI